MKFATRYEDIIAQLDTYDPLEYSNSRNYVDGNVSYLSPYISRGIISTKMVMERILAKDYPWYKIEKFLQELAWRDYWQNCWLHVKNIDEEVKNPQSDVSHFKIPKSVRFANTGIKAIDKAIQLLKKEGYMHNHIRMYVASLCCNFGHSHWLTPAKWMYYHLIDGDWASNALSWQWIAGTNSKKKYLFNQENVNRYCHSDQHDTYIDIPYDSLTTDIIPSKLLEVDSLKLKTNLPDRKSPVIRKKNINLFTYYNLDPTWNQSNEADNVLILEPSLFQKYPISDHVLDYTLKLAQNIPKVQYFFGEFSELNSKFPNRKFHYKEHPTNNHFEGKEYERDWMFDVHRYYPSFFSYWRKCKNTRK